MIVIVLLILLSILVAGAFLGCFIWSVRSGQYEDTCTPSLRLLMDDHLPASAGTGGSSLTEPSTTGAALPAGALNPRQHLQPGVGIDRAIPALRNGNFVATPCDQSAAKAVVKPGTQT